MISMRHTLTAVMTFVALATPATPVHAQIRREQMQERAFEYSGELARGQRLIVRSVNGDVTVEPARGRTLEIVATKKWRRGNPADVKIEATRVNGGRDVLLCAKWTERTECDENHMSTRGISIGNNNDVQVHFTIKLPEGANAALNTTNGEIEVKGATGTIEAHTTNGAVTVESTDAVEAHTTNGDVEVKLSRLPSTGASYHSTNGDVTITLPADLNADLDARTTNGRITSDFSVTVSGSMSRRSLRGTIGHGGPKLEISTTNGDVRIQKR
jgi:DUF4097 and DUF4098 domain-containing protein YvlB